MAAGSYIAWTEAIVPPRNPTPSAPQPSRSSRLPSLAVVGIFHLLDGFAFVTLNTIVFAKYPGHGTALYVIHLIGSIVTLGNGISCIIISLTKSRNLMKGSIPLAIATLLMSIGMCLRPVTSEVSEHKSDKVVQALFYTLVVFGIYGLLLSAATLVILISKLAVPSVAPAMTVHYVTAAEVEGAQNPGVPPSLPVMMVPYIDFSPTSSLNGKETNHESISSTGGPFSGVATCYAPDDPITENLEEEEGKGKKENN